MRRILSIAGNLLILVAVAALAVVLVKYGERRGEEPVPQAGVFQSPLGPTLPPALLPPTYTPAPTATVEKATKTPAIVYPPGVRPTTTWQPPQSLPADVTADWPVYTDLEAGYSIRYPPDAYFHSGRDPRNRYKTVSIDFNVRGYGYQGMVISVIENSDNLTLEQYLKNRGKEDTKQEERALAQYLSAVEEIQVGNLSALWSKADQRSDLYVATAHQDKIFVFAVSGSMAERVTGPETKDLAYKILSSFTIISNRSEIFTGMPAARSVSVSPTRPMVRSSLASGWMM